MDKLSAIIVDDEPLALNFLRGILSKFPNIDIEGRSVGSSSGGN